ncbi:NUDIX hydrolase [Calidifontibacter terrae]
MSFAELRADATRLLADWIAPDEGSERLRLAYLSHLEQHSDAMSRDGVVDHLTGSGFVFDPTLDHVAMVFHGKAKLWLQPGGHFEEGDRSVVGAALREIREETGLDVADESVRVVDLHHHQLPAAFGRCRSHLDLRVGAVLTHPQTVVVSPESEEVRWCPVQQLPTPTDPDLPATIRRVRRLLLDRR